MNPTFTQAPLALIAPSPTNPRKTFDPARLQELADSIKASGVHQPVLLRPLPAQMLADTAHLKPRPEYELVAGERRYRASLMAGADSIPAIIRDLSNDQVLETQITENLQRDDLTALEEAQGYEVLMQHSGITAEQVAEKIGKSRTYVFNRLKLMDLGQDGREALRSGMLDTSKALLLARIPDTTLQVKALKEILRPNHPEGVMSARMAGEWIRSKYMLKLEQAPFSADDASFAQGACSGCLKRTGAAPDIFADVNGADVCTDPSCYEAKVQVHRGRVRDALEESGHTVIDEREAKELIPFSGWGVKGYAQLDTAADSPTDNTLRKELSSVLDSGELVPVMVVNPHKEGELIACIPEGDVRHWLAKAGRKEALAAAQQQAEEARADEAERDQAELRREYERAWRARTLRELHHTIDQERCASMTDGLMHQMAMEVIDEYFGPDNHKTLCDLLGLGDVAQEQAVIDWVDTCYNGHGGAWTMADALTLLLAERDNHYFTHARDDQQENNCLLIAAKDAGLDIEAIKAQVQAEMTEREAQKAADAQALADAAKAPLPLAPAAQANGGRGEAKAKKGKGQKPPADAGAGHGHLNAQEAMQGIAAALQGEGVGPASRPDGGADQGGGVHEGADAAPPTLASQAAVAGSGDGASVSGELKAVAVGDRVRITYDSPAFKGKLATVAAINSKGKASLVVDGMASEYTLDAGEFERVEGGEA